MAKCPIRNKDKERCSFEGKDEYGGLCGRHLAVILRKSGRSFPQHGKAGPTDEAALAIAGVQVAAAILVIIGFIAEKLMHLSVDQLLHLTFRDAPDGIFELQHVAQGYRRLIDENEEGLNPHRFARLGREFQKVLRVIDPTVLRQCYRAIGEENVIDF